MLNKFIKIFMIAILMALTMGGCIDGIKPTAVKLTKEDLTQEDLAKIDIVKSAISRWDVSVSDSGSRHNVNKIAFYDFQNEGELVFYKNYPIAGYYGIGYYVTDEGLVPVDPSIYDADAQSLDRTLLARTSYDGMVWNSQASEEEKNQMIVDAYLQYLNSKL